MRPFTSEETRGYNFGKLHVFPEYVSNLQFLGRAFDCQIGFAEIAARRDGVVDVREDRLRHPRDVPAQQRLPRLHVRLMLPRPQIVVRTSATLDPAELRFFAKDGARKSLKSVGYLDERPLRGGVLRVRQVPISRTELQLNSLLRSSVHRSIPVRN